MVELREKYKILQFFTVSDVFMLHSLAVSYKHEKLAKRLSLLFNCEEDAVIWMGKQVQELLDARGKSPPVNRGLSKDLCRKTAL